MDEPKDYNNRWRFTKDIPLSAMIAFLTQTIILVWFLAGQNAALNAVIKAVSDNQSNAYTKDDSHKDRELLDQRFLNQAIRQDELVRRLQILESQPRKPQ